MDSVFRVLEPVIGNINEKSKSAGGFSRFGFGSQKSDWFRIYKVRVSTEAYTGVMADVRLDRISSFPLNPMMLSSSRRR